MNTTTPPTSDAIARHPPKFNGDDGSDRIQIMRNEFEEWYVPNASNYTENLLGSRQCDLQWRAWKAAREIAAQHGEGEPTCWRYRWKDDDGDWLPWQMIGQATVEDLRANKDPARYELQALYASPPHVADALDGERYRWLREPRDASPGTDLRTAWYEGPEALDAAIDAAMEAEAIAARAEAGDNDGR